MNELALKGKQRTILISISLALTSISTILIYQMNVADISNEKSIQQTIRLLLTALGLWGLYKGIHWIRIVAVILFSISFLGAAFYFLTIELSFETKLPVLVMSFIYGIATYHFGISKSYKAFAQYQRDGYMEDEVDDD